MIQDTIPENFNLFYSEFFIKATHIVRSIPGEYQDEQLWTIVQPLFQTPLETLQKLKQISQNCTSNLHLSNAGILKAKIHGIILSYIEKAIVALSKQKQCDNCKIHESVKKILRCSRCHFARYCSIDCQKKAWPQHKKMCTPHQKEVIKNNIGCQNQKSKLISDPILERTTICLNFNLAEKKKKKIYNKAVQSIKELGWYFNKNVLFDDLNFEITFLYDFITLHHLEKDEKLRSIIAPHYRSIIESDSEKFIIKDREIILNKYKKCASNLLETSKSFFENFKALEIPVFEKEKVQKVASLPYWAMPYDFVSMIYEKSRGLCVGEYHDQTAKVKFFSDIKYFLSYHKITVFLEYPTSFLQKDIDHYLDSDIEDIPPALFYSCRLKNSPSNVEEEEYLQCVENAGSLTIIREAKAQGIKKIIAIDTLLSRYISRETCDEGRFLSMNFEAMQIINNHLEPNEKFIIFCGRSHAINSHGVPGFGEIFGVPTLSLKELPYSLPKDSDFSLGGRVEKQNRETNLYYFKGKCKRKIKHLVEKDYKTDFCMTMPRTPLTFSGELEEEFSKGLSMLTSDY